MKEFVEILCQYMNLDIEDIKPDMRIGQNCDMIDILEMGLALEQEYKIEIPVEMLETLPTVSKLWAYIKKEANI